MAVASADTPGAPGNVCEPTLRLEAAPCPTRWREHAHIQGHPARFDTHRNDGSSGGQHAPSEWCLEPLSERYAIVPSRFARGAHDTAGTCHVDPDDAGYPTCHGGAGAIRYSWHPPASSPGRWGTPCGSAGAAHRPPTGSAPSGHTAQHGLAACAVCLHPLANWQNPLSTTCCGGDGGGADGGFRGG